MIPYGSTRGSAGVSESPWPTRSMAIVFMHRSNTATCESQVAELPVNPCRKTMAGPSPAVRTLSSTPRKGTRRFKVSSVETEIGMTGT